MQKPFFSIIIVSLNAGEEVKKTLESVLTQTCLDYEVIIKDGESQDGSLNFIKENARKGKREKWKIKIQKN